MLAPLQPKLHNCCSRSSCSSSTNNICSSPVSVYFNMKAVTGSGSASIWQTNRGMSWPGNSVCLCSSSSWRGAEDQRTKRAATVFGAKIGLDPYGTLHACLHVWLCVCVCVPVCACVSVFVDVHKSECGCFLLPLYNYPINLNLSSGTKTRRINHTNDCMVPVQIFVHLLCFLQCVKMGECSSSAAHIDKILHRSQSQ